MIPEAWATQAGVLCTVSILVLMVFAPMGKILRIALSASLVPLAIANYFIFAPRLAEICAAIIGKYRWQGFGGFVPRHAKFFGEVWQSLKTDDWIAMLAVCGTALTAFFLVASIMHRYFRNQEILGTSAMFLMGVGAICASYGLLLPVIVFSLFYNRRRAQSLRCTVEGQEAIKDMWKGLFLLKLKLLVRRKDGIFIHELLRIPRKFENRGVVIFGAPGSGKSHLIKTHFLPQLRKRGDMQIVFDYKGEFTQAYGEERDALIISPLDARSVVWDICQDIDTEAKAWEFVRMVVRQGDAPADVIFEDWGRDLLTASIIKLQREKERWTFRDFYHTSQDIESLIDAVQKYRPESEFAANFRDDSRQFEAIKGTIRRAMARLEPLARAWGNGVSNQFSIREWLRDNGGTKPLLIVRYDPLYAETIGAFVANFFNFFFASVLSLADSGERQIWAVLDEFQTLPKIPKLFEAARAGRSKGLRLLLGTQDLGRIDQMYRHEGSRDTLVNLLGFKLIGHLGSQGMQDFAAGLLSKNKVRTLNRNVSHAGNKQTVSYSTNERFEPAIAAGEFGAIPVPTAWNGAQFWLVHQGLPPVRLRYITNNAPARYAAKIDSTWLHDADRKPARAAHKTQLSVPLAILQKKGTNSATPHHDGTEPRLQ